MKAKTLRLVFEKSVFPIMMMIFMGKPAMMMMGKPKKTDITFLTSQFISHTRSGDWMETKEREFHLSTRIFMPSNMKVSSIDKNEMKSASATIAWSHLHLLPESEEAWNWELLHLAAHLMSESRIVTESKFAPFFHFYFDIITRVE